MENWNGPVVIIVIFQIVCTYTRYFRLLHSHNKGDKALFIMIKRARGFAHLTIHINEKLYQQVDLRSLKKKLFVFSSITFRFLHDILKAVMMK